MIWVTVEELRDRLVYAGLDRALTPTILEDALKRVNRGECLLSKRLYLGTHYYRPAMFTLESGTPNKQRASAGGYSNRLPIMPPEKCLQKSSSTSLKEVNDALAEFSQAADKEAARKRREKVRFV